MNGVFEINAERRSGVGKGEARRLRRAKKVPGILYGGGKDALPLTLDEASLAKQLDNEAVYSHILSVRVGGETNQAVLKEVQRHPYKAQILHVDLQRVTATEKLQVRVPLHFLGEQVAPGVKEQGGAVAHLLMDIEVSCLPKDLPEFVEVDLSKLLAGETIHVSELTLPSGVELASHVVEANAAVVAIQMPRGEAIVEEQEQPPEGEEQV